MDKRRLRADGGHAGGWLRRQRAQQSANHGPVPMAARLAMAKRPPVQQRAGVQRRPLGVQRQMAAARQLGKQDLRGAYIASALAALDAAKVPQQRQEKNVPLLSICSTSACTIQYVWGVNLHAPTPENLTTAFVDIATRYLLPSGEPKNYLPGHILVFDIAHERSGSLGHHDYKHSMWPKMVEIINEHGLGQTSSTHEAAGTQSASPITVWSYTPDWDKLFKYVMSTDIGRQRFKRRENW